MYNHFWRNRVVAVVCYFLCYPSASLPIPITLTWTDSYFGGERETLTWRLPLFLTMSPPLWAKMPHVAPRSSRRRKHPVWSHGMQKEGAGWQNDEAQTSLTLKIPQQRKYKYIKCVQLLFSCNRQMNRWIQDKATVPSLFQETVETFS